MRYIKKAINYIKIHGVKRFFIRLTRFYREKQMMKKYHAKLKPTEAEIKEQRKHKFEKMPLISIVVPLYNTNDKFLRDIYQIKSLWRLLSYQIKTT